MYLKYASFLGAESNWSLVISKAILNFLFGVQRTPLFYFIFARPVRGAIK